MRTRGTDRVVICCPYACANLHMPVTGDSLETCMYLHSILPIDVGRALHLLCVLSGALVLRWVVSRLSACLATQNAQLSPCNAWPGQALAQVAPSYRPFSLWLSPSGAPSTYVNLCPWASVPVSLRLLRDQGGENKARAGTPCSALAAYSVQSYLCKPLSFLLCLLPRVLESQLPPRPRMAPASDIAVALWRDA